MRLPKLVIDQQSGKCDLLVVFKSARSLL
jgi:hypothetical protein